MRWLRPAMAVESSKIVIRDLESYDDLLRAGAIEREAWGMSDADASPLTLRIALCAAGNLWLGAFDGPELVGFAFAFFGREHGRFSLHSHMLAVRNRYRGLGIGHRLKLAQRERALTMGIHEMTWTFDPLQSKNAHFNFAKLGVISDSYRPNFYGAETSSVLHRNGTDRLWVTWPMDSRRVEMRLQGKSNRSEMLEIVSSLPPLVRFGADAQPVLGDMAEATARQRIAIEIPSDIGALESENAEMARQWRLATRRAFTEALSAGFFVAEFCRAARGHQGPGVYLLEKGSADEHVPEMNR